MGNINFNNKIIYQELNFDHVHRSLILTEKVTFEKKMQIKMVCKFYLYMY